MEMKIKLNGSNYVSEKTKHAFEEALQDGHRVEPRVDRSQAPVRAAEVSAPVPRVQRQDDAELTPRPNTRPQFQHLERGIDRSYEHQQEILRIHEQYLKGQAEYANVFSQLMAHQRSLLDQEDGTPEHTQALLAVLDHLSKSLSQFHEHQGETLKVHDRFLSHQSEYAQAQVQLLQKQVEWAVNGHGPLPSLAQSEDAWHGSASGVSTRTPVEPARTMEPAVDVPTEESVVEPQPVFERTTPPPEEPAKPSEAQAIDPAVLESSLLACVSDATGYPAEMLELDMDMEADLGIDSIKRVEILGALQDAHPTLPAFEAEDLAELRSLGEIIDYARDRSNGHHDEPSAMADAPAPSISDIEAVDAPPADSGSLPDAEMLKQVLLDIVSESTGYPVEMLELDMDMEADLGIDSIKRVEILGALQDVYPDLPQFEAEALGELRTLGEIVSAIDEPPTESASPDSEGDSKEEDSKGVGSKKV